MREWRDYWEDLWILGISVMIGVLILIAIFVAFTPDPWAPWKAECASSGGVPVITRGSDQAICIKKDAIISTYQNNAGE